MSNKVYIRLVSIILAAISFVLFQCTGAEQNSTNTGISGITFSEVRTASDRIIVAYFCGNTDNYEAIDISNTTDWKINGKPAEAVHQYVTCVSGEPQPDIKEGWPQVDWSEFHIYLETDKLVNGKKYTIDTPYGKKRFKFNDRKVFCESIKVNQVGYSALARTRYANFAIWLGTGGGRKLEGSLPDYTVINTKGKSVAKGTVKEVGEDASAGGFVYRIDLSAVPEGGPYVVTVNGIGSSYQFGVGGDFTKKLAYTIFRAQYLQRCGCPIPEYRVNPCHTIVYDVDGPIGEANVAVVGDEPSFKCYGGYHDAADADRRAYHMSNPMINLMIYETFPEYFTDGQFHIPGDFDADYNILNYENNIPDIIDEAIWGTLIWEYLQNEDGTIHFGTETLGYPEPFDAPMDHDSKKYGTVRIDNRATCPAAGLFMHLARIIKPYNPQKSAELIERADRAFKAGMDPQKSTEIQTRMKDLGERISSTAVNTMAEPEQLYYHIQRYLLTQDKADHDRIRSLYTIADGMKDNLYQTPGYSLNDNRFDNPAYIMSYILEKEVPTDPEIVAFFKTALKNAADANIEELRAHAFPVGNNPDGRAWGHNVRQPQYAAAPLLYWQLTKDQAYFDAASELMDYKLGLNPIGICYVTELASTYGVVNFHSRESAHTRKIGLGQRPGYTPFGPGLIPRPSLNYNASVNGGVIPAFSELPKERLYVDNMAIINFNEFTIFETLHYDALYTILAGGGKWNNQEPYKSKK